jgi:hypothetical protein
MTTLTHTTWTPEAYTSPCCDAQVSVVTTKAGKVVRSFCATCESCKADVTCDFEDTMFELMGK